MKFTAATEHTPVLNIIVKEWLNFHIMMSSVWEKVRCIHEREVRVQQRYISKYCLAWENPINLSRFWPIKLA